MGKSRNAHIKAVTIPRLELQSAVLATRIDRATRAELELDINRVVFWTDSTITLNYIRNETPRSEKTRYQANGDIALARLTPADDASRGLDISSFLQNKRWLNGP